jgi:hypothetical protein
VFCDGGADSGGSADDDYGDWHFVFLLLLLFARVNQLIDYWDIWRWMIYELRKVVSHGGFEVTST